MRRIWIFALFVWLLFPITKDFVVDGRVLTLHLGAGGVKLYDGNRVLKKGGPGTYYISPYVCRGELKSLQLTYQEGIYTLLDGNIPILSSVAELYSPRAICFNGRKYLTVGMGRDLLIIYDRRMDKISGLGGVLLDPMFVVENGTLRLKFKEVWRGKVFSRKENIPPEREILHKEISFPPSEPFWYNYDLFPNRYLAFGDSITYGCGYGTCEHDPPIGYPHRLEALLKENIGESEVLNRGIPEEDTFGGIARINEELTNARARYLLLMEGTNDVVRIEYPLSATEENLRGMIIKSMTYGTLPIIATIIPRKDWFWYHDYFHRKLLDTVKMQRKLAREYSLPLADQFDAFMDFSGGWENLLSDGNHPTEEGYQLMAEVWEKAIETIPPYPPHNVKTTVLPGFLNLTWEGGGESDLAGFFICKDGVCVDLGLRFSMKLNYDELMGEYELKSYDKAGHESEVTVLSFH